MYVDRSKINSAEKTIENSVGIPSDYIISAINSCRASKPVADANYRNGISDGLDRFLIELSKLIKNNKLKATIVLSDNDPFKDLPKQPFPPPNRVIVGP